MTINNPKVQQKTMKNYPVKAKPMGSSTLKESHRKPTDTLSLIFFPFIKQTLFEISKIIRNEKEK